MTTPSASQSPPSQSLPPSSPPRPSALEPAPLTGRRATLALLVVLFASFMDLLDVTIVTVAAPTIASDLQASPAQLQWLLAAYTLALGSGLVTGGRVGDVYGRRTVFLASLTAFAVASAACALAPTADLLVAMRVVQGLAGGFMVPQVFGIIRSSFAPALMAKAFGAFGAVQGLAAVAGPLLGGALVDADLWGLGWRTIFWINLPIAVVALALGVRVLPKGPPMEPSRKPSQEPSQQGGRRNGTHRVHSVHGLHDLDGLGAVLVAAAVVLVLLPLVQGRDWGWPWWGWAVLATGVLVLGLFVALERRLAARGGQPVLDPALLANRPFTAGLTASVLFFGALASFFLVLSVYLQAGTGRSAGDTGLVILPYAIGSILTSGAGVALAARAGRTLVVTGSLLLAASQVALWLLVRDGGVPGYWPLAGALFLGGLGLGLGAPILVNVVLAGVPGRQAGAAGGVLSTVNQIGGAIGIAVLGTLFFSALPVAPAGASGAITAGSGGTAAVFGQALAQVMPWQALAYVLAAVAMLALPRTAAPPRP